MDVINRINYETYFLLYADNELPLAEKQAVEDFVRSHPDLAPEFEALLKTRFQPDTLSYIGKEQLYKSTAAISITKENCEEYFVQYYDNELDAVSKKAVEDFVAAHPSVQEDFKLFGQLQITPGKEELFSEIASLYHLPAASYTELIDYFDGEMPAKEAAHFSEKINNEPLLQQELQLLAQTKLSADTNIKFPRIESLYRKERKDKPVIPLWMRFAAAAAVFIFVAWMAFWRNNGQQPVKEQVANNKVPVINTPIVTPDTKLQTPNTTTVAQTPVVNEYKNALPVNSTLNSSNNNNPAVTSALPERNNNKQAIQPVQSPELKINEAPVLVQKEQQPENRLPEDIKKIIENPKNVEQVTVAQADPVKNNITENKVAKEGAEPENVASQQESSSSSSISVLNISADQVANSSKLKNVSRKISRFFERRIKNSNKSISIGGIEVAMAR
jgi:hypothetical protein